MKHCFLVIKLQIPKFNPLRMRDHGETGFCQLFKIAQTKLLLQFCGAIQVGHLRICTLKGLDMTGNGGENRSVRSGLPRFP